MIDANRHDFSHSGRTWLRAVATDYISEIDQLFRCEEKIGVRDIVFPSTLKQRLEGLANSLLPDAKLVRATTFNKTIDNNWSLPWHQDRVIAVKSRHNIEGFSNWTHKGHYWHCEPPMEVLDKVIFAQVYLDESNQHSGGLEIALGSHRNGKVRAAKIAEIISSSEIEFCNAKRGDILFAKSLIIHKSGLSKSKKPRRVLRVDFSSSELPEPLLWQMIKT